MNTHIMKSESSSVESGNKAIETIVRAIDTTSGKITWERIIRFVHQTRRNLHKIWMQF